MPSDYSKIKSYRSKQTILGITAGIVTIIIVGYYASHTSDNHNVTAMSHQIQKHKSQQTHSNKQQAQVLISSGLEPIKVQPLPRSLQGTDIDGQLRSDENGNLILELPIKQVFDYFLSLLGEEQQEQLIERLISHIKQTLPLPASDQAIDLLDKYLTLKEEMRDFENNFPSSSNNTSNNIVFNADYLTERLNGISQLRSNTLGNEAAEAFFLSSETYDKVQIDIHRINNSDIDDNEKIQLALEAEKKLPEHLQQRRHYKRNLLSTAKTTVAMKESGATASELYNLRTNQVGMEYADRMAVVDQEKEDWQSRIADYKNKRNTILNNKGMAEQDKTASINEVRENLFSHTEVKRVIAMDSF